MIKPRVLVWPSTTELGREAVRALRDDKETEVIEASSFQRDSLVHLIADVDAEGQWVEDLREVCLLRDVTHVFPCHDAVLQALAEEWADYPPIVLTPPRQTVLTCLSKKAALEELRGVVELPLYAVADGGEYAYVRADKLRFVKPDAGNASRGCILLLDTSSYDEVIRAVEVARQTSRNGKALLVEYLPGAEYTVDCFSDREKGLLWARARERVETRGGISWTTRRVGAERTVLRRWLEEEWAKAISNKLSLRGAWFFQVKLRADGTPVLLEVAPRFGGGAPLARANGVNLPLLTLYESLRLPLTISDRDDVPELRTSLRREYVKRFEWDALYVDLDDTLVCKGRVNPRLLALCCQALNAGKRVRYVTRDGGQVWELPPQLRSLFGTTEVCHVDPDESKADYISSSTQDNPVFIDDSFREREDVRARLGIPVFDAAGAECLLEDL